MSTYKKIPPEDKLRIIRAYRNDEDYLYVATILGIKISTARSIVSSAMKRDDPEDVMGKPRGGAFHVKVDSEMREFIADTLGRNPAITIKNLNIEMRQLLPHKPQICDRHLGSVCRGMFFTLKKLESAPFDR